MDQVLDAELVAAGVVVLDRQDVDAHHQAGRQNAAGQVAGQEQAAHRDAAGGGGVDDHVVAGGHQDALHRGGDGDGGGEVGVVALVHHHGDQDGAQRSGVGGGGTGNAAEEVGIQHIDHAQAAPHPADAGVGQGDQLVGQAARTHQHAHGDEEGHRHQAVGADALDHLLADGGKAQALVGQAEDRGQRHRIRDGEAQQDHHQEGYQKDGNCRYVDCHITLPPSSRCRGSLHRCTPAQRRSWQCRPGAPGSTSRNGTARASIYRCRGRRWWRRTACPPPA